MELQIGCLKTKTVTFNINDSDVKHSMKELENKQSLDSNMWPGPASSTSALITSPKGMTWTSAFVNTKYNVRSLEILPYIGNHDSMSAL